MKRKTSTPLYLIILLFLLTIPHSQAQRNGDLKNDSKKHNTNIQLDRAKSYLENIRGQAQKNGFKPDTVGLRLKSKRDFSASTGSFKPTGFRNITSGRKLLQDSLSQGWLKRYLLTSKGKVPAIKSSLFTARQSAAAEVPEILYVDQRAGGTGDGSTWENAYVELAFALDYARDKPEVREIWVANGHYHPRLDHNYKSEGEDYDPRDNVFMMLPNVKIYGGFAGNETSLTQRRLKIDPPPLIQIGGPEFNATILSGDVEEDDDNDPENRRNNTYHVVMSAGDVGTASLDGFIIVRGHGNDETSITVNEQTISRNTGGGMVTVNSAPSLSNLFFSDDEAKLGSAIYASGSDFLLTNALIGFNYSSDSATVYLDKSAPVITNATITQNKAGLLAGGILLTGVSDGALVRNTIIYKNSALKNNNIFVDPDASISFEYSIIEGSGGSGGWQAGFGTDQGSNLDTDPLFEPGKPGLQPISPAVNKGNNAYFQAGQSPDLSAITTDQRGTPRFTAGTIDIGALEIYLPQYRPDNLSHSDVTDRDNTFLLVGGAILYGGFAGTETDPSQRDLSIAANASILSGDFAGNDIFNLDNIAYDLNYDPTYEENAYRVVTSVGLTNSATVLDGFTIEGGNNFSDNFDETLFVNETLIPASLGSGVVAVDAYTIFINVTVRNNIGTLGGGIGSSDGGLTIFNSLIYHNVDAGAGSGMADFFSFGGTSLANTTIAQNLSLGNGPAYSSIGAYLNMGNSIIYNNILRDDAPDGGGITPEANFLAVGSYGGISYSIVGGSGGSNYWKLYDYDYDEGINDDGANLDEDPQFTNANSGNFTLSVCSPAIDAAYSGSQFILPTDLSGKPRIVNNLLDMGAFESQDVRPANATALAKDKSESTLFFENDLPQTFSVNGEVCNADLLTLIPDQLNGDVTAKVWVDPQVQTFNGAMYLQRHFDIIPAADPEASSSYVLLYFTQAEFDELNKLLPVSAYLPTGDANDEDEDENQSEEDRKANIRVYKFHGLSSDGSGNPATYGNVRTTIEPDWISWDAGENRWEIGFYSEGFSGFFTSTVTQNPLPVRLISFEGKRTDDQKTRLDWKVAEQEDIEFYHIEYSENGKDFDKIGQVAANALESAGYSFTDSLTHSGDIAYYRLKILEADGKTAFSKIVSVKLAGNEGMVAYPIPARNELWIDWKKTDAQSVQFIDLNGRILKTVKKQSASQKVDITAMPSGIFILKANGNSILKVVKE